MARERCSCNSRILRSHIRLRQTAGMARNSARGRILGLALKHYRELAGVTLEDAAGEVALTKSSLSRQEHGEVLSKPVVVKNLLVWYGAPEAEVERLVQLARDAAKPGWW